MTTQTLLSQAKKAKPYAARLTRTEKDKLLNTMADSLLEHRAEILTANKNDISVAGKTIAPVMLDRLRLTEARIIDMAKGLRDVAGLPDPVGEVLEQNTLKNDLHLKKVRVPMGVIAIIYESRPNVTADAAALCLKSGNVCVLRGGKEAIYSNKAIVKALHAGLAACDAPKDLICLVEDTTRQSATDLMLARGFVDLLIPRGGAGLIRACVENAQVPCIETGTGICHVYIDKSADIPMALSIVNNAKTSRPSVCNSAEVCLVHAKIAGEFLPQLAACFATVPVEMRLCPRARTIIAGTPAKPEDFDTEFLDYIMAIHVVNDVSDAVTHIAKHSTGHSEAIVATDQKAIDAFCSGVDSAAVYVNASTRFTDGGVFGLGCEMGISTQKLGARGPMGLCELTSYQYIIEGSGQIR